MKVTLIFLLCVVFCWFCSVLGAKSCKRTNKKPWRYCEDACSSDSDCMDKKKCLCDGDCGMSCITPGLSCGEPPSISNGQKRKTGTGLGDTVTYSCTQPYQRRGPETRTCRGIGKWDGKKTRCRKFCKDPGDTPYGNRDKGRSDSSHRVGTSIRYWCFPGTQLVGSAVITCMKSGDWSDKTPNCSLPSCGKPVKPDNAIFLKPSMDKDKYSFNDVVLYKCEFGYYGIGSRMQTCLKGTWDSTTFQCLPKSCGDPGTPANGGRSGQVYTFKSKVFFSCDRGHIRVGPAFRQCQSNQKWSGVTPTCQPVDCGSLPTPKNGAKTEETKTTYQGRVSFQCVKKGHELKGSRVRVCQEDGRWDGTFTKCDPVECDDPGTPRFGGRNPDKDKYIYGDTVTYECKKNFTMSGGAQVIVCSETKTWTGKVPICLAPCGDPGTPKGGFRRDHDFTHGKQVRFSCPVNWQMEGSDTITCNNGRWDKQAPKCLAPCVFPGNLANGRVSGWDFRHGKRIDFYCNSRFRRIGASSSTCNDGRWSDDLPKCIALCDNPGKPTNGFLHGNDFLDGKSVSFSCYRGYDLYGNSQLTCRGGSWDGLRPECKRQCRVGNAPNRGSIEGSVRPWSYVRHADRVTYRCDPGTDPDGQTQLVCNDGRWSSPVPECKAQCGNPGRIVNGATIGSLYNNGAQVIYSCYKGFTLSGQDRITCRDGMWTPGPPTCEATCNDPGAPLDGFKRGSNYEHGQSVSFGCNKGFQLKGASAIVCNSGNWNDTIPTCEGVCPELPAPANGQRNGDSFTHDSWVRFTCNNGYTRVGSYWLQCRKDGTWSEKIPLCKADCVDPGIPASSARNGSDFTHGSSLTYTCQMQGFSTIVCEDGRWSHDSPRCEACGSALGMESGGITNSQIVASSHQWFRAPSNARLNGDGAWCSPDHYPHLEIDFGKPYKVTGLATQGSAKDSRWVGHFTVSSNLAGMSFNDYRERNTEKLFVGNRDSFAVKKHQIQNPFIARKIRILPKKKGGFSKSSPACMRVEVYGCDLPSGCVMVGSRVFGKWGTNLRNADYYFKAYVKTIGDSFVEVDIESKREDTTEYQKLPRNTGFPFVLDFVPMPEDLKRGTRVIARWGDVYYAGTIATIGSRYYRVLFDDGDTLSLEIKDIRLLKRPTFCPST